MLFLFIFLLQSELVCKRKQRKTLLFSSAFHEPSSEDWKKNSMQTRAFLMLDKKYLNKILLRTKQLPIKANQNSCAAREVVPERRAIHKLNAHFFL